MIRKLTQGPSKLVINVVSIALMGVGAVVFYSNPQFLRPLLAAGVGWLAALAGALVVGGFLIVVNRRRISTASSGRRGS